MTFLEPKPPEFDPDDSFAIRAGAGLVVATTFLVGLAIGLLLVGLLILFAWNVGVVGIVAAAGGNVSAIGYGTSVGAAAVLAVLKRLRA